MKSSLTQNETDSEAHFRQQLAYNIQPARHFCCPPAVCKLHFRVTAVPFPFLFWSLSNIRPLTRSFFYYVLCKRKEIKRERRQQTTWQCHSASGFVWIVSRMKEICFCCCQTLRGPVTQFTGHNSQWALAGGLEDSVEWGGAGLTHPTHWTPAHCASMGMDSLRSWSYSSGHSWKYQ